MKHLIAALIALAAAPLSAEEPVAPPQPAATAMMGPALHVTNIDKELKFYVDGLGMKKLMQMGAPNRRETMLGFAGETMRPAIILLDDTTNAAPPAITQSNGFDRMVMRVNGLQAVVARLRGLGFTVADVRTAAMGYSMAFATDPDGYRLELVESPPRKSN